MDLTFTYLINPSGINNSIFTSMTKVVNMHKEQYDVYIGRPSKWGNPYSHRDNTIARYKVSTKAESIEMYERHIKNTPELFNSLYELNGKILGCHCKPKACHGDILFRLVSNLTIPDIY